ncbi:MAG: PAS domain-containing protein, partial [Gammaproteobacteria bacterium]|nr:PAS domain-containing protein [Gammaproteobacteria bacterium]
MYAHKQASSGGKDELLFAARPAIHVVDDPGSLKDTVAPWKVMIIDDDEVVHQVTLLVLSDFKFQGRSVKIIQGYSGKECRSLLEEHPDTAVLLLDVVMESDNAGLETVSYIRENLKNRFVRIILRTGQPGQAPEREVISRYDINDYREKTDLTTQKLYTALTTALRAYSDLREIEKLALSNTDLENRVRDRTKEIMKINLELQKEIDDRKQAYKNLARSEARLSEAQQIARIGNWERDINNADISASDQVYRILGFDLAGPPLTWQELLELVVEEDKPFVHSVFDELLSRHKPYDIEHRMLRKDG